MAEIVTVNSTIRVQATFRGFSGEAEDPLTTTVAILDDQNVDILNGLGVPTRISAGAYQYSWTPGVVGSFTMVFVGVFAAGQTSIPVGIDVVAIGYVAPLTAVLGQDREFVFIADLDPLYVDSEELQQLFPDADPVEILELIHAFSVEANDINETLGNEVDIPTPLMREFVFASTACALTRLYDPGSNIDATEMSLGDLSVRYQRSIKDVVTRANATTWCEIAAILRDELYRFTKRSGIRAIVKGANVIQCMPDRNVKTQEWASLTNHPYWIK